MSNFSNWLFQIGSIGMGVCLLLMPYVFFSIGRKFDKKFGKVDLLFLETGFVLFSRFWRVTCYMFCIIYSKIPILMRDRPDPYFWNWFGNYNFRENASWLQIIVSYAYIGGGLTFVILGTPGYILRYFFP